MAAVLVVVGAGAPVAQASGSVDTPAAAQAERSADPDFLGLVGSTGPAFLGRRVATDNRVPWCVSEDQLGDTQYGLAAFDHRVVRHAPAP